MEKLELKHLIPYLLYGAKMIAPHSRRKGGFYHYPILLKPHNISYATRYKPILRPFSDLTKEIEINGEKFIPIVELAKICDESFQHDKDVKTKGKIHGCKYLDKNDIVNVLAYHEDIMTFGLHSNGSLGKQFHVAPNQYTMFQKLFEWHFDVFGLIEKGLAIDINSLKD